MQIQGHKYRRKKADQAATITIESGDTLAINSGATVTNAGKVTDNTEVVAATNVITAAESGKTFFLASGTEFVSTLPAPAAGLKYTFVVSAAPSGASYTIVTTDSANIIVGQVFSGDLDAAADTDSEVSGGDTISFVDAKAVKSDRVDVVCDGTNWYAYGFSKAVDAITITTAG